MKHYLVAEGQPAGEGIVYETAGMAHHFVPEGMEDRKALAKFINRFHDERTCPSGRLLRWNGTLILEGRK